MSDGGNDAGNKRNKLFDKRQPIWDKLDKWVSENPSAHREEFETVKSAMLIFIYPTIRLFERINKDGNAPDSHIITQEFTNFINAAHRTKFLNSDSSQGPKLNLFSLLVEIFSAIPEFQSENGMMDIFWKLGLSMFLTEETEWDYKFFDRNYVRSIYWKLLFTLRLMPCRDEKETEESISYDENRSKLMFASFVIAVMAGIGRDNEELLRSSISNYDEVTDLADYINMLLSSTHFTLISNFLSGGLWTLVRWKVGGGTVTSEKNDGLSKEQMKEKTCKFQLQVDDPKFEVEIPPGTTGLLEEAHVERATYAVVLLKKGCLKSPDGYKLVQKGGRPRKYPISQTRKRKVDEPVFIKEGEEEKEEEEELEVEEVPRKRPNRYQKKAAAKSSPRKQQQPKDPRRNINSEVSVEPSTSSSSDIPPAPVLPPKPPKKKMPTPEEVGIILPVYIMQANLWDNYKKECDRRRVEGLNAGDRERVEKIVFEGLSEMHLVAQQTNRISKRPLTEEQKRVEEHLHKNWLRGNKEVEEDSDADVVEEEDEEQIVEGEQALEVAAKVGKSGKSTKRWKRRY